jgi:hypothetical protein
MTDDPNGFAAREPSQVGSPGRLRPSRFIIPTKVAVAMLSSALSLVLVEVRDASAYLGTLFLVGEIVQANLLRASNGSFVGGG